MARTRANEEVSLYPGSGKAKCFVCGDSVINHDIGPCPTLNQNVIYVDKRRRYEQSRKKGTE